eukprot:TRINITY_DN60467_c0_g1_i1.p1 TRINITY_DN60467_c0_g1~~TRINITY_DN60467_c0_g1_i1.p1  ORF type:complete len:100 (+),score=4.80 TRINITY_DN60467_c0_g1_i1:277-576(+)
MRDLDINNFFKNMIITLHHNSYLDVCVIEPSNSMCGYSLKFGVASSGKNVYCSCYNHILHPYLNLNFLQIRDYIFNYLILHNWALSIQTVIDGWNQSIL